MKENLFKRAPTLADLEALQKYRPRVRRVHLDFEINQGLAVLKDDLKSALPSEQVKP